MRILQMRNSDRFKHTAKRQHAHLTQAMFVGAIAVVSSAIIEPMTFDRSMLRAQAGAAQGNAVDEIAAGDRSTEARQAKQALQYYEAAIQSSPRNTQALWKASGAAIDVGEVEPDAKKREATFAKATDYARRAIATDSNDAESNFAMARALGRSALTVGPRDRIKYAKDVRHYALKTLSIDPRHPGAMHVMGVWNAEIMRLNGVVKLVAKTVLGGQILGTANWASAASYLEQSVANDPQRAVHRLDLARVYRDMGRKADARASYESAMKSPLKDANDELDQREASEELRALK